VTAETAGQDLYFVSSSAGFSVSHLVFPMKGFVFPMKVFVFPSFSAGRVFPVCPWRQKISFSLCHLCSYSRFVAQTLPFHFLCGGL
jgi:hypothetical protein